MQWFYQPNLSSNATQKARDEISLKAAHVVNMDHPFHARLLKFKEMVEVKTNGAIIR